MIVLDAHADAWFDGAGDNGDGLAVLIALARHFAKPENRPDRTLVLIASAGHHSPGLNGPRGFVAANPDLAKRAVLVRQHRARRAAQLRAGRSVAADGYRETVADSGEAPIYRRRHQRIALSRHAVPAGRGALRHQLRLRARRPMSSGETGGFSSLEAALVTIMQAPPLYHTTGEVADVISTPGLERMARFLAYFVKQSGKAPRGQIVPLIVKTQPRSREDSKKNKA